MFYALVHYPCIDTTRINQFRRKYDPQVDLIEPHITLVFPVSESMGEKLLVSHIESILSQWKPFRIHLQGFHISLDNYLYLTLQEGNSEVICLHDELYTGVLAKYFREDIPFVPHITLGVFDKDVDKNFLPVEEAKQLELDYCCIIDKLHLVKFKGKKLPNIWSKEFYIKNS